MRKLIEEGLGLLGIDAARERVDACLVFLRELRSWNASMNLVADADDLSLVSHLLDSLSALHVIGERPVETAADAGSGGGFPGIPLAVFLPGVRMTLIERSGKKAGFLRNASALMSGACCVTVAQEEIQNISDTWDLVLTRALASIGTGLDLLWPLTGAGGRLVFYKGKKDRLLRELDDADLPVSPGIVPVPVPYSDAERHLVVFRKPQ